MPTQVTYIVQVEFPDFSTEEAYIRERDALECYLEQAVETPAFFISTDIESEEVFE